MPSSIGILSIRDMKSFYSLGLAAFVLRLVLVGSIHQIGHGGFGECAKIY